MEFKSLPTQRLLTMRLALSGRGVMVAATDLKSVGSNPVPVRVRPPAPVLNLFGHGLSQISFLNDLHIL